MKASFNHQSNHWEIDRPHQFLSRVTKVWKSIALPSTIRQFWRSLGKLLIDNCEPRVWQTCDRQGHIRWSVYDPTSGQSARFSSEAEVRFWLEQRLYNR